MNKRKCNFEGFIAKCPFIYKSPLMKLFLIIILICVSTIFIARNGEKHDLFYVLLQFTCDMLLYIDLNGKFKERKNLIFFLNCLNMIYFLIAFLFFEAALQYSSKKLHRHWFWLTKYLTNSHRKIYVLLLKIKIDYHDEQLTTLHCIKKWLHYLFTIRPILCIYCFSK